MQAVGLWWERLHIFSDDVVQHTGVVSQWTRDLRPPGEAEVQPGELVELHVTVPPDLALLEPAPPVRLDILEFDWLFWRGTDDPMDSLRTPGARDPVGDFTIRERTLVERPYSDTEATLAKIVDGYRAARPADFDSGVLVVRDTRNGWKDIIAWWRVPVVKEHQPRAYFVAELPGPDADHNVRDASSVQLHVARDVVPGASVRLHGTITDSVVAVGENAQPVPQAVITLGGRTTTSTADGRYVIDARIANGDSRLGVARPGADTREYTVRVSPRDAGGTDVTILDGDVQVTTTIIATDADPALAVLRLDITTLVHRLSGTVVWPDTRIPTVPPAAAITLRNRYVCAIKLEAGALRPQIPKTSRDWDVLRSRPDVLRSARPDRPARNEATDVDGAYELSFIDLQADANYLFWVEAVDPRDPTRRLPDAVVRTIAAPNMRRMNVQPANTSVVAPDRHNRRVVVATGFLEKGVEAALDVLKIIDTAADGAQPALRLLRAQPKNIEGIDASPPADVDELVVDAASRRVTGLTVEVLPLVPVFELPEDRSPIAGNALTALQSGLDARHPRGHLLNRLRWVLDARRGPTATWNDADACSALERTLVTHPSLTPARMHDPAWGWWRADAVSLADLAHVDQGANAVFANRQLIEELQPVLTGPVPRLLGLFQRRHLHVSPGHGLYAGPAASTNYRTGRGDWAGYGAAIENWGGEDENAAGVATFVRQVAEPNGIRITVSRETDPTVVGTAQQAGGVFATVNPTTSPDHPRLWQQNAYYWLAAVYDLAPGPGGPLVLGNPSNGDINSAGINRRLDLFRDQAADPTTPVDVFVALHTNGGPPAARGYLAMYLDIRPTPTSPAPGQAGYVEGNPDGRDFADRLATEIGTEVNLNNRGARSYYSINGNVTIELATTLDHFRNGSAVQGIRSLTNPTGALAQISFPPPGRPDRPRRLSRGRIPLEHRRCGRTRPGLVPASDGHRHRARLRMATSTTDRCTQRLRPRRPAADHVRIHPGRQRADHRCRGAGGCRGRPCCGRRRDHRCHRPAVGGRRSHAGRGRRGHRSGT
ncbi:carboxypeptidase-like regulatory domain-containing protein [Microlunatus sp. Gsoil 973]|uniref:carboxypeptidase-like regulatory domain-containing protein n=1 Tax=Microlunatus sp. Gsoil 973 TaxID=2672569 RepID=UPI0012B4ACDF|nr:carboxypeptidase-like regulatory domain-containing protein [Microlunatus sp. Gsoil 973]QGN31644.1 hypothetical protein GJV80_01030 [Microlunatus sp. Gsoil 973]